jgi:hypothetical protein
MEGDMGAVEITESSVTLRDKYGREVVHWTSDEFIEDDGLAALAACNAIHLFHTEGIEAVAELIGKDISNPDYISFKNNAGQELRYPTADLV